MLNKIQNGNIVETVKTAKKNEVKNETNQQEIKDGKKKLALALGALGVAGAGIVIAAKTGKLSSLKKVKSATTNAKGEIKEIVLKKPKRFTPTSSSYVTKTGTDGKTKTFLKEVGTISNPNFRNGETIRISKLTDLTTGKISSVREIKKASDIPADIIKVGGARIKKGHVILPDGKKAACTYTVLDEKGKNLSLRSILDGKYDKKTGLLTQTEKFCTLDKNGKIIFSKEPTIRTTIINKQTGNQLHADFVNGRIDPFSDIYYIKSAPKGFRFSDCYPRGAKETVCLPYGLSETGVKNWANQIDDDKLRKVFLQKFHI